MGIFGNILNEYELNTKPSFNENTDTESQILRARGQNAELPIYTPQQAEAVVNSEQARRDYIQQPQQTQQQGEFTAPPPPNIPQAPQAPSTDNLNQGKSQGRGLFDLSRLKDEAKDFIQNIKSGGDAFRSKDDLMKTEIARIRNDGGLLQTLTRGDEKTAEITKQNKANIENIAKKHGYDLGVEIDDDGKVYFGKSGENGEPIIKEVTPSFLNDMGAYRNEILGALALTALTGGQNIPLLFATSATGSALGAGADFHNRDELTQENETAKDYLSRMGGAVADDLVGGAIVSGIAKGGKALINHAPSVKNALNNTAELGGKVWDNLPISSVVRQFGTDNIGGATDKAIKNLGGETEYLTSLNQAKEALGDKAFSEFANERVIQIPRTKFETINKGVDFVNDKLVKPFNENIKKVVSQADLNEQEANLFLANLAHENGAKIITNSVAHDPQAYGKAVQMFKKLNGTTKQTLDEALKDSPSVIKVFDDFEKRTKADFGAVMDTLNEFFSKNAPQSTELIKSNKRRILTNARQIFGDSDELSKFTGTLKKPTNLNEWQDLRNLIGNEIGSIERNGKKFGLNSQDNATLRLLRTIRNDIDSSIDDIFNQFEKTHPNLGERAKELINTARKDYHAYKNMEYSDLYHAISTGIKDEAKITDILIKSVNNENGADLNAFLSVLGNKERANAENAIIRAVLEKNTAENITDFKAVLDTLNELPLQSEKALSVLNHLNDNAPILKNTGEILNDLKTINPKGYELSQGISHSIKARIKTMIANRLTNKLKSKAPLGFGDNQALQNHINNAIKGSGNLEIALKNIAEIPAENLPSNARVALEAFKKDFANFSAEIKAEVTQDIKQTLKEMSDKGEIDILEMAKNIKPKQQADQVAENLAQAEVKQAEKQLENSVISQQERNAKTIQIIENSPQKGRDMQIIGRENFNADIVEYAVKNNKRVAVEILDEATAKELGFKYPHNVRRTIYSDEIAHALNEHGEYSPAVRSGTQKAVTMDDISKWTEHADSATHRATNTDELGQKVLISGKQINGYYVVVEQVQTKNNDLAFKTMFFEKGDINKSNAFKNTKDFPAKTEAKTSTSATLGYEPTAKQSLKHGKSFNDDIIPQNAKHSDFLNKKTDLGTIKEVYELPNGELQFLINGEWIHERTASFTNLKTIRELIRKPNLDEFDIWRLKSVKRNFDLNRGDKSSQIAKEIDLYNDEFAYKTRRKGEQLDNAQRLYQGIETRLDEVKKQTENLPPKPKTGAELKAEFDDLSEKYDIEAFLKDRENISSNDIRYTRTAANGSSSKTSRKNADGTYTYSKPEMEHNYKADFTFTKQDTARLRKQIQSGEFDENLLNKLKNDLDGAEPQGYTNYLKSADDIAESKAEKEFKQTGKEPEIKELKDGRVWDNKHGKYIYMFSNESLGGGVLGGSVSGIQTDENGNIIGFDPADFAKGFIGGAIATKALKETAIKGAKIYADKIAKTYPNIAKSNSKLFAEIVNKTAKEKFGNLAVESGEILQKGIRKLVGEATDFNKKVIGGENALLSLKDTTYKANLAKAKAMQEKGTSELEIWEKTGWYKDELDGKWKFEINPSGGELKRNVLKYGKAYKLSEVLDDKELFEAYPQLSEVKVITSNNLQNGFAGSFNQETKIIKIASNNANIKNTLYHEIQHAVQEIENFSKGSNLDNPAIKNYARTKNLAEYYDDKIKEHYKKHDEIIKKYGVESKEFKNWADELEHLGRKFEAQLKDESYETYLRQGGEAEARNVSNRLNGGDKNIQSFDDFVKLSKEQGDNFSDSELRQMYLNLQKNTKPTHPLETLDIPRNERLNLGGDGVSEARNLPNKEKRGIYNVAFNDKKSTQIYKDLDDIEQAIKFEKGRADTEKNGKIKSGFGALHIKKHTEPNKFGYVTTQEYLNMGEVVRKGEMSQVGQKRVYKLTKDGVTFRVVIGDSKNKKERIISFYSDRKAK